MLFFNKSERLSVSTVDFEHANDDNLISIVKEKIKTILYFDCIESTGDLGLQNVCECVSQYIILITNNHTYYFRTQRTAK